MPGCAWLKPVEVGNRIESVIDGLVKRVVLEGMWRSLFDSPWEWAPLVVEFNSRGFHRGESLRVIVERCWNFIIIYIKFT